MIFYSLSEDIQQQLAFFHLNSFQSFITFPRSQRFSSHGHFWYHCETVPPPRQTHTHAQWSPYKHHICPWSACTFMEEDRWSKTKSVPTNVQHYTLRTSQESSMQIAWAVLGHHMLGPKIGRGKAHLSDGQLGIGLRYVSWSCSGLVLRLPSAWRLHLILGRKSLSINTQIYIWDHHL